MRDQIGRTATYIYINIYTRNLKFAQLVTALAMLANKYIYQESQICTISYCARFARSIIIVIFAENASFRSYGSIATN